MNKQIEAEVQTSGPKVHSLLNDRLLEDLPAVLNEADIALMPLIELRNQIVEEEWSDQVNGVLGLYIRHMERVLERGRWLLTHQELAAAGK